MTEIRDTNLNASASNLLIGAIASGMSPAPCVFLERGEVQRRTALGRTTIWRLIKADAFPKPLRYYGKAVWIESEIDAWMRARIADRDAA